MALYKLAQFAGESPRVSKTLLQDNEAQNAVNTKLYSGELRSWIQPTAVSPRVIPSEETQTIFRVVRPSTGEQVWFAWDDDVNVVRGPVYDTQDFRLYFSNGIAGFKVNASLVDTDDGNVLQGISTGPYTPLPMGVLPPPSAPIAQASSESQTPESRAYVYTYVSTFGGVEEESGPSPVSSVVTLDPGGSVALSGFVDPRFSTPHAQYTSINKIRIYRTVIGSNNNTAYLFVKEIPSTEGSTIDTVSASFLGESIQSTYWSIPPEGLSGLVGMPNGFLAGFVGNQIHFSEPFQPHAWDRRNVLTTEHDIVALGVVGTTLVVGTKGNPYIVTGADPSLMSMEKLPVNEPCMSKRSMSSDEGGVMYASPNGVVVVTPTGANLATRNLFTREEWEQYYPSTMHGSVADGRYYLFYNNGVDVSGCLIFDRNSPASPFTRLDFYSQANYAEPTESILYMLIDGEIKSWDFGSINRVAYSWKSKMFITERPINFGVLQVEADFEEIAQAQALQSQYNQIVSSNQALFAASSGNLRGSMNNHMPNAYTMNGSILRDLPELSSDKFITVEIIGDEVVRATVNVISDDFVKLPSGYKTDRWEFRITGNIPVRHVKIAESVGELKLA